jgi:hypothetical protein
MKLLPIKPAPPVTSTLFRVIDINYSRLFNGFLIVVMKNLMIVNLQPENISLDKWSFNAKVQNSTLEKICRVVKLCKISEN